MYSDHGVVKCETEHKKDAADGAVFTLRPDRSEIVETITNLLSSFEYIELEAGCLLLSNE